MGRFNIPVSNSIDTYKVRDPKYLVEQITIYPTHIRVYMRHLECPKEFTVQSRALLRAVNPEGQATGGRGFGPSYYVDSDYGVRETLERISKWLPPEAKIQ